MSRNLSDCQECGAPEGWCSCNDGVWIPQKAEPTEELISLQDGDQTIYVKPDTAYEK